MATVAVGVRSLEAGLVYFRDFGAVTNECAPVLVLSLEDIRYKYHDEDNRTPIIDTCPTSCSDETEFDPDYSPSPWLQEADRHREEVMQMH